MSKLPLLPATTKLEDSRGHCKQQRPARGLGDFQRTIEIDLNQ